MKAPLELPNSSVSRMYPPLSINNPENSSIARIKINPNSGTIAKGLFFIKTNKYKQRITTANELNITEGINVFSSVMHNKRNNAIPKTTSILLTLKHSLLRCILI